MPYDPSQGGEQYSLYSRMFHQAVGLGLVDQSDYGKTDSEAASLREPQLGEKKKVLPFSGGIDYNGLRPTAWIPEEAQGRAPLERFLPGLGMPKAAKEEEEKKKKEWLFAEGSFAERWIGQRGNLIGSPFSGETASFSPSPFATMSMRGTMY